MNKKQFEIYKKWRVEKHQRDLERKQDEMAARGLASSGIRNQEEQWLKKELEADLVREESEALEYEVVVADNKRTSRNQRTTNGILALIAIASFFSTVYFSYQQNNRDNEEFILRNRPYLVITDTQATNLVKDKSADFKATIKNVGVFPAQILNSSITCPQADPINAVGKTIIGNGEQMIFVFSIINNLGVSASCKLLFTYSTVGITTNEPYSTEYNIKFTNYGIVMHENAVIK